MSLSDSIKSFLAEKFWRPVTNESVYYNPFNTAVYAALFGLAAAYMGRPLLQRFDVDIDRKFVIAVAPFVFLGGAVRSLEDFNIVNSILLVTPFIYLLMFSVFVSVFAASKKLEQKLDVNYHHITASTGVILLLATLSLYSFSNFVGVLTILGIFGILSWFTYIGAGLVDKEIADLWFALPVAGHWLDASSSFIALSNGAEEKHVLAQFFIQNMGPEGMFVLKALIIIPVTYYIHRDIEGFDKKYYLFLIALLGFALGTRNLISFAVT